MPDLKFDGRFFYSANTASKGHPLLVPMITNPDFIDSNFNIVAPPGIKELIEGDLGIAEKIMNPILSPIINLAMSKPLLVESIANVNNLEKNNPSAVKNFLIEQYIPKDMGLKAIEKTIISSMMESHKPLIEFLKVFLELLGVSEDIVCRYLGSSIKILGKEIGIPSRNPAYWNDNLGYTETITYSIKKMLEASALAEKEMDKTISDKHPFKKTVTGVSKDKVQGNTDLPSYYVAYFDENGNDVEPPKWVKDSNKWFSKQIQDRNGNLVKISAPFKQLSDDLYTGVSELRERQYKYLESIETEKEEMLKGIDVRLKEVEKITNIEIKKNEIDSINKEKIESLKILDELIDSLKDVIDGNNIKGNNFIDDDDLSKGVNSPAVINEWIGKSRGSQFRMKYYPEQRSTVQTLVNYNGEAKEPYVFIPKFGINYNGNFYNIEVPLAFDNQLKTEKVYSFREFYDSKLIETEKFIIRPYSNKTVVSSLNLNPLNEEKPFENYAKTHFSNNITNEYIPDKIKRYFLPLEWEEILEYNIIQKSTGKILRVEKEYVPFKIDVENDYELRLIKVINQPLLSTGKNNTVDNFFPDPNGEIILIVKNGNLHFLKTDKESKEYNISIDFATLSASTTSTTSTTSTIGVNDSTLPRISNKFSHGTRYVDEKTFIDEKYFYLRKNTKWGRDYIDSDDSEIYQIKNITKKWKNESDSFTSNIIIDNYLKTITFNYDVSIPEYISEYVYDYNFIFTDNSLNNNIGVKVKNVTKYSKTVILTYEGELLNETITNNIKYQWIESSFVETYQEFTGADNFTATIYNIIDINYLPEPIKNGSKSIIIQGFDKSSLFSTLSDRIKKEGNDIRNFIKPNAEADNIYNIIKIENVLTRKGIVLKGLKLDFPIPLDYNEKAYSSNQKDGFYYPLRIYTVPQTNNQGISNKKINIETPTGTLYTTNNTIPEKLNLEDPESTIHSTPDLNEENLLKEGVIYHGLDPRFVDRNKWKVFYLVEAIKKDNFDTSDLNKTKKINKKDKGESGNKGKEWYGLIDKYTALPMVIIKLVPLIVKIIPLAMKIIQTISNPKKMKDLLLNIGLLDESVSKFPRNFTPFSKNGIVGKEKELSKMKVPKTIDEYETEKKNTNKQTTNQKKKTGTNEMNLYYAGVQINKKNPTPIFLLDGQALVDFGKGAFGKKLFSFGVELKNGEFKSISKLKENPDVNKEAETKPQGIFQTILNFVKLPFEIIFKIFKWIIDWVKKLLNPVKIPDALKEFLSFKWLLDIIGKKSLFEVMGLIDVSEPNVQKEMDNLVNNITGEKAKEALKNTLKSIRGNNLGFVEVLIYDIIKNGQKIRQETEEIPYTNSNNKNSGINDTNLNSLNNFDNENVNKNNTTNNNLNNTENTNNGNVSNINDSSFCGKRIFSLSKMFPIPFFGADIEYNLCELPILFLKPLEIIVGLLRFIQDLLNSFISMPVSILGLEPTISVPKFGKEIPFANILEDILGDLKKSLIQITHS